MFKKMCVLLVIQLALISTVSAFTERPLDVHIEAETAIFQSEPDLFTATGDAVDAGLVCASGDLANLSGRTSELPRRPFLLIRISKHFDCADGSGTFDLRLVALIDKTTGESAGFWTVSGGTGDYDGLHGKGRLIGVPIVLGKTVLDIYDGRVH